MLFLKVELILALLFKIALSCTRHCKRQRSNVSI